jgi:M6 family metalloprotease-like protein
MIGTHLRARLAQNHARAMYAPAHYPAEIRVLFLRVDFQPEPDPVAFHVTGSGTWLDPLYSHRTGAPVGANDLNDPSNYWVNKSKTDFIRYWAEASYGKLTITVDVSPVVYRLDRKMSHYGSESNAALENMIYDSVKAAEADANPATRVDFALYDAVLVVHAGAGEETDVTGNSSNDVWSLYFNGEGRICQNADTSGPCLTTLLRDGNVIGEGIIMPQTDSREGSVVDPLGVYVHEFGHWLGLPDLYCTARSCSLDGVGKWSLMADGIYNADPSSQSDPSDPATCANVRSQCIFGSSPASLDAWSRVFLGFAVPRAPDNGAGTGRMTLNPVGTSPEVVKIQASSETDSQYFLLENRRQTGFDKGLPGHGLLVWLVDDKVVNHNFPTNSINNSKDRPGLKLIEADNDWKLLSYGCSGADDCGSAGDPFPGSRGKNAFTPHTQPSSRPYESYAWVNVRNIEETAEVVSAEVGIAPLPPPLPGMLENTVVWQPNAEPDVAGYNVYRNGTFLGQTAAPPFTDASAKNGDDYQVAAVDAQGNESDFSGVVTANMQVNEQGRGDGRCFIATAAWGSTLDPHVESLRNFRDRNLLTNAAGRAFVAYYYRISPPAAAFIARHEGLRALTRWSLTPVVYGVEYPGIFTTLLLAGIALLLAAWRQRRLLVIARTK